MNLRVLIAAFVLIPVWAWAEPIRALGWLEHVSFPEAGITLVAKLDTGAKTSSISADDVETFKRNGAKWVRFTVVGREGEGSKVIEAPVVARKRIHSSLGRQSRYEVELALCLGGTRQTTLFTLSPRRDLPQAVLVGRLALERRFAVDSSRTFTAEPPCGSP